MPKYEKAEQGALKLTGRISKVNAVAGKKGAPLRVEVLVDDDRDGLNGHKLQEMRGHNATFTGPFFIEEDAENPDQMHLDEE